MATSKQNLSDLLREEVKQDETSKADAKTSAKVIKKVELPAQPPATALSRMTKAQLLEHIELLQSQQPPSTTATSDPKAEEIEAKNQALAKQVKDLENKISTQEKAIADAEKTITTLKTDSAAKTKLEKELTKQQGLVEKLYAQVQVLEAEATKPEPEPEPEKKERTVEEDRALVLARIASYQANLQFPSQPASSIPEEDIGWFD